MGRRQHPDVERDLLVAADALDDPLLQDAEQLRLQRIRHVANLVEEERAAVGELELAGAIGLRDREGAYRMAEQLALEQVGWDGWLFRSYEEPITTGAQVVNRARHELLAGTGLAGQQHGAAGGADAPDEVVNRLHRSRVADHALERRCRLHPLPQVAVLGAVLPHLESLPDRQLDDLEVERLEYVIEGAELHRVHGRLHSAVRREQHHRHLGVDLAYTGKQLETRHARHLEIGEDQVELLGLEPLERLFATLGAHRLDPHALEQDLQHAAHLPLVVDHQHLRHRGPRATGSSTRNVVPRPTALSTDTVPWCAWTTRWTSARPRPVPPLRRVKKGVNTCARASAGMPGPSSITSKPTWPSSRGSVRTVMWPPAGTICSAFTIRLRATW